MVWDGHAFTYRGVGRERPLAQRGVRCRRFQTQHGSGADVPMPNVQHEVGRSHAPTQLRLSA